MNDLTHGELFAGIGGFSAGFAEAGIRTAWAVEIDSDARRVLRHHSPGVLLLDDVRQCGKHNLPPVDVISGGFPCQDLSVAGMRAGLGGKRSGLFYEMTRIVDELRPRLLVWENVPGLRNSFTAVNPPPPDAAEGSEWEMDEDSDFEAVLCELHRIGFHRGGWTSLDARWFGVAQRRRRIFGVFARGDIGGDCAAEILALAARGCGHPAPGGEAGPGLAATVRSRSHGPGVNPPGRGGEDDFNLVVAGTLGATGSGRGWNDDLDRAGAFVAVDIRNGKETGDVTIPLQANGHGACPNGTPFIVSSANSNEQQDHAREADTARCLDQTGGFAAQQGETVVAFNHASAGSKDFVCPKEGHTDALIAGHCPAIQRGMIVRRLTPLECCRLQGFADDWLDLDPPLSDSAKYRLFGNAVCRKVAAWLGKRIAPVLGGPP